MDCISDFVSITAEAVIEIRRPPMAPPVGTTVACEGHKFIVAGGQDVARKGRSESGEDVRGGSKEHEGDCDCRSDEVEC